MKDNLDEKKKSYIQEIIFVILIVLMSTFIILDLINTDKKEREKEQQTTYYEGYGTVIDKQQQTIPVGKGAVIRYYITIIIDGDSSNFKTYEVTVSSTNYSKIEVNDEIAIRYGVSEDKNKETYISNIFVQ